MSESILTSTKKMCGVAEDYTHYDDDFIMHINSVFSTFSQLGIGPEDGLMISDATATWDDLIGENKIMNSAKTLTFLQVRLYFDPPATSFALAAMQEQVKELQWRLNVEYERTGWIDPDPESDRGMLVIDGGDDG